MLAQTLTQDWRVRLGVETDVIRFSRCIVDGLHIEFGLNIVGEFADLIKQSRVFMDDCELGQRHFSFHFFLITLLTAQQNDVLHAADGLLQYRLHECCFRFRVGAQMHRKWRVLSAKGGHLFVNGFCQKWREGCHAQAEFIQRRIECGVSRLLICIHGLMPKSGAIQANVPVGELFDKFK